MNACPCAHSSVALVYLHADGNLIANAIEEKLTQCHNSCSIAFDCTQIDLLSLIGQDATCVAKQLNTFCAVVLCGVCLSNDDQEACSIRNFDSATSVKNFVRSLLPLLKIHTQADHILTATSNDWIVKDCCGGALNAQHDFCFDKTFGRASSDTISYAELEIERTARIGYEIAQNTRRLTLVDRADLFESARMWRKICADINEDYPYITLVAHSVESVIKDLIATNQGKQALCEEQQRVFLSSNVFGDILTSTVEALSSSKSSSMLIGDTTYALYTCPTHANIATVTNDMLHFSFGK